MIEYSEFVDQLRAQLKGYKATPMVEWEEKATHYVNGLASAELRRLVSLEKRRADGVFFTDSSLAEKVLELLQPAFDKQSVIYDATCGAGNLLIATANRFTQLNIKPEKNTNYLLGTDIHPEFVTAANLRLQINNLLLLPGKNVSESKMGHLIQQKDALVSNTHYKTATHIFLNPPFDQEKMEKKLSWATGKVSMAAVFMEKAILNANRGATIMAILPDVLRSGTRYQKWRDMMDKYCITEKIELLGQFDAHADVDVYAIKLTKRLRPIEIVGTNSDKYIQPGTPKTLQDIFDISVGPVVDYRDAEEGILRPYVVSRGLVSWSIQKKISRKRKHAGASFAGPFVVIKRTSRATDQNRAMATIIQAPQPVYVDNHLIILKPKVNTVATCALAIKILKDPQTNAWLNEKIRCRHLTVKAVKEIPVWEHLIEN